MMKRSKTMKHFSKRMLAAFLSAVMLVAGLPLYAFVANAADTLSYQQEMFNIDFTRGTYTASNTSRSGDDWGYFSNLYGQRIGYVSWKNYPSMGSLNAPQYLTSNNAALYSDNMLSDFGAASNSNGYLIRQSQYNQNYELELKYRFYDTQNFDNDKSFAFKLRDTSGNYFGVTIKGKIVYNGTVLQSSEEEKVYATTTVHTMKISYHSGIVVISVDGKQFYMQNLSSYSSFFQNLNGMEVGSFNELTNPVRSGSKKFNGMSIDLHYIKCTSYQYRDSYTNHLKGQYLTGTEFHLNRAQEGYNLTKHGAITFDKTADYPSAVFSNSKDSYMSLTTGDMRALLADCNDNSGFTIAFYGKSNKTDTSRFFDYSTGSAWNPDGGSNSKYLYFSPNGAAKARASSASSTGSPSISTADTTAWNCWIITIQRGIFSVYRNSSLVGSVFSADITPAFFADLLANGQFLIGASCWGSDYAFDGNMRDLRIYDVAVTPGDMLNLNNDIINNRSQFTQDILEEMNDAQNLTQATKFYEKFMENMASKGDESTYADVYTNMVPAYQWYNCAKRHMNGEDVLDENDNVLSESEILASFKEAFNDMQPYTLPTSDGNVAFGAQLSPVNAEDGYANNVLWADSLNKTFANNTEAKVIWDNNSEDNHKTEIRIYQPKAVLLYTDGAAIPSVPVVMALSQEEFFSGMQDITTWQYNYVNLKKASVNGVQLGDNWKGYGSSVTGHINWPLGENSEIIPKSANGTPWDSNGKIGYNYSVFKNKIEYSLLEREDADDETLVTITSFVWDAQTERSGRKLNTQLKTANPIFIINHKKLTDAMTGAMRTRGMLSKFSNIADVDSIEMENCLMAFDTATWIDPQSFDFSENYIQAAGECEDYMNIAIDLLSDITKKDATDYIESQLQLYENKMAAMAENKALYYNMAPAYAAYLKAAAARDKMKYAGLSIAELNEFYPNAILASDVLAQCISEMTEWNGSKAYSHYRTHDDGKGLFFPWDGMASDTYSAGFRYQDYYKNVAFWNGDSIPDYILTKNGYFPQSGDYASASQGYVKDNSLRYQTYSKFRNYTDEQLATKWHTSGHTPLLDVGGGTKWPYSFVIDHPTTILINESKTSTPKMPVMASFLKNHDDGSMALASVTIPGYRASEGNLLSDTAYDVLNNTLTQQARIELEQARADCDINLNVRHYANDPRDYYNDYHLTWHLNMTDGEKAAYAAKLRSQTMDDTYFTLDGLLGDTYWHGNDDNSNGRFDFAFAMSRNDRESKNRVMSDDPKDVLQGIWYNSDASWGYQRYSNEKFEGYMSIGMNNRMTGYNNSAYDLAGTSAANVMVWNKNGVNYDKNTYLYDVMPQWKTQAVGKADWTASQVRTYYTTRLGTNHIYVVNFRPINDILENHNVTSSEEYQTIFKNFYNAMANISDYDNYAGNIYAYLQRWDELIGFNLDEYLDGTTERTAATNAKAAADAVEEVVDNFQTINDQFNAIQSDDVYDLLRQEFGVLTSANFDKCYGASGADTDEVMELAYGAMGVNYDAFGNDAYNENVFTGEYNGYTIAEIYQMVMNLETEHQIWNENPAHPYLYAQENAVGLATFVCANHFSHDVVSNVDMSVYNELDMVYGTLDPDKYKGSRDMLNEAKNIFDSVKVDETALISETEDELSVIQSDYVDQAIFDLLNAIGIAANAQSTQNANRYTATYRLSIEGSNEPITVATQNNVPYGTALTMQADTYSEFPAGASVYAWGITVNGKENTFYKKSNTFTSYIQGDVIITAYLAQQAPQDENSVAVKINNGWGGTVGSYTLNKTAQITFQQRAGTQLSLVLDGKTITLNDTASNQIDSWKIVGSTGSSIQGTFTVETLLAMCGKTTLTIEANVSKKLSAERYNIYFADQTVGSDAASSLGTISLTGLSDKQAHAQYDAQYDDKLIVTTAADLDFGADTEVWALALREKGRFVPVAYADDTTHIATYQYLVNRDMTFYVIIRKTDGTFAVRNAASGGKTFAITDKEVVHALEHRLPFSFSNARRTSSTKWTTYSAYTQNSAATVIECGTLYTNDPMLSTNMFTLNFVGTNNVYKKVASNPREVEKQYSYSFAHTTNCLTRSYVKYQYTYNNQSINAVSYANVCTLNFES